MLRQIWPIFWSSRTRWPSAVEIGVSPQRRRLRWPAAGGILIQPTAALRSGNHRPAEGTPAGIAPITAMLQDATEAGGYSWMRLFKGLEHQLLSKYPVRFECDCSRERTFSALGHRSGRNRELSWKLKARRLWIATIAANSTCFRSRRVGRTSGHPISRTRLLNRCSFHTVM
jgi:hypothetical protein